MDDKILIDFFGVFRERFLDLKIKLLNLEKFKNVETSTSIQNFINAGKPEVSMSINSDLNEPINNDLHSLGLSFSVTKKNGKWILKGEVGWSSFEIGFDEVGSIECRFDNAEIMLKEIEGEVTKLVKEYVRLVDNYKIMPTSTTGD